MTSPLSPTIASQPAQTVSALVAHAIAAHNAGDLQTAEGACRQVLSVEPNHPVAVHMMGVLLSSMGQSGAAIPFLRQAATLSPDNPWPHLDLARAEVAARELGPAVAALKAAIVLAPDDVSVISAFSDIIEVIVFNDPDPDMADHLGRAITTPGIDAHFLDRPLSSLLEKEPNIAALIGQGADAIALAWSDNALSALTSRPPMITLIARTLPANPTFEKLLTTVRRVIVLSALDANGKIRSLDKASLALVSALARQSHNNEFLYVSEEDELAAAGALRTQLEAKLAAKPGTDKETVTLTALVGLYFPLHTLNGAPWLAKLARRIKDPTLASVVADYVSAPLKERALAATMPSTTPVDDDTSQSVQGQYEENPYPRWFDAPTGTLDSLSVYLRNAFPHLTDTPSLSHPARALIAGCGSGRQAFILARQLPDTQIIGVDLSRASLAHAKRWQDQLADKGIGQNVTFGHGDILNLGVLDDKFDVIESFGVLHHMKDPMAGWRVLAGLAKPGGLMRIGLYSEVARTSVVQARAFIAEHGFDDTPKDIARFRQAVIQLDEDNPIRQSLIRNREFYAISSLRDLVFHRQEHRFTMAQIREALSELALDFVGFADLDSGVVDAYVARFPDDPTRTDLDNWEAFEMDNPRTFRNTYNMWLRTRA